MNRPPERAPRCLEVLPVACCVLAFPDPAAYAQSPRERVFGEARLHDGKPWANAEVLLLSRPVPWIESAGRLDEVRTSTGTNGQFRAEVLPAREYTVFAFDRPAADGAMQMSQVLEGVRDRESINLVAEREPRPPLRVEIDGLEAWEPRHRWRVRMVAAIGIAWEVATVVCGAEHRASLPPFPGHACLLEVLGPNQRVLSQRRCSLEHLRQRDPFRLGVSAPVEVRVRVTSRGEPLRGTEIGYAPRRVPALNAADGLRSPLVHRSAVAVLGTTDGAGRLTVQLPIEHAWPPDLRIVATGRALEARPSARRWREPDRILDVEARLPTGHRATGRLVLGERPLAGVPVALRTSGNAGLAWNQSDAAGRVCFDGRFSDRGCWFWIASEALPPEVLAVLPPTDHPLAAWVPLTASRQANEPEWDLGDLRLDRLCVIDLQVRRPDGSPLGHAQVERFEVDLDAYTYVRPMPAWLCDRGGRLRLLLPEGRSVLSVTGARGFYKVTDLELTANSPRHQRLTFVLEPMVRVAGTVRNRNGRPVAGARFGIRATAGCGDPSRLSNHVLEMLNHTGLCGTSDAGGRFELFYVAKADARYEVGAALRVNEIAYTTDDDALVLAGQPVENAELLLDCPDEVATSRMAR